MTGGQELQSKIEYRVTGMDCSSCAAKITAAVRATPGVEDVKVSIASQIMTLAMKDNSTALLSSVEAKVNTLGYSLRKIEQSDHGGNSPGITHLAPAYKSALLVVILLNVGYGIIEMMGGVISGSQALKADALDFLGDGSITLLGLLAIGWSMVWRARSALIQGVFLAVLGVGVLFAAGYRVFVLNEPDAELMGIFGAIALCVNVAAALVLMPHRAGDANVRAVWLFSRNDAIGNLAVVVAAGLVWWTGKSWPDIVVAAAIAALFLRSAWVIVRDAQEDLNSAKLKKM